MGMSPRTREQQQHGQNGHRRNCPLRVPSHGTRKLRHWTFLLVLIVLALGLSDPPLGNALYLFHLHTPRRQAVSSNHPVPPAYCASRGGALCHWFPRFAVTTAILPQGPRTCAQVGCRSRRSLRRSTYGVTTRRSDTIDAASCQFSSLH